MSDMNTVTISGTVRGEVESYTKEDLVVSRFYLGVAEAHEKGEEGTFKVVAFGKTAEYARNNLKDGERATVLGKLLARGGSRGPRPVEIQAKVITLPNKKTVTRKSPEAAEMGESQVAQEE